MVIVTFLENGFEANQSSKTNVLSVWKGHFLDFIKFLSDEVENFFWESEAERSKLFKSKFRHMKLLRKWFWSYLECKSECSERLKKALFSFLQVFWVIKLKALSGKVRQNIKSYLNQNLIIGNFLEKCFEANLSSRTNVLSVWKRHFSVFIKFLSDEVDLFFWENETKCSSLHKSKFGHMKLFRKWFWGYPELKNECPERLERAFFSFLHFFDWRSWNLFLENWDNAVKTFSIKSALLGAF